jgi:hypothetical protein
MLLLAATVSAVFTQSQNAPAQSRSGASHHRKAIGAYYDISDESEKRFF